MNNFAIFFIHRPAFAIVISLVILIVGALSITALPVSQYPKITPPTVQVEANYLGASSETVEESVATPIEQEVNGAENMIYMSSYSSSDGRYVLTCSFQVGTDLDIAAVDVQNRVSRAQSKLPYDVTTAGISVKKQSPDMLMVLSVNSPDNSYDELFLSNYAKLNITDRLARVPGVGNVTIVGEREYSMRIWVRPDKLAQLGLTAGDLRNAIKDQNVQAPAGAIGQPPANAGTNFQYTVKVKGRLTEPDEFKNIILKTSADGSLLRIKDVARTELGAKDYKSFGRLNGNPATVILINQLPGANALDVAKGIKKCIAELSQNFPVGVKCDVSLDNTLFVTNSIEEVLHTLVEAIALVLIVVFVFLGNFRATLIPMLAVPVSLIGTFALFIPLGFSINLLTLFGLVLAIGLVVDDAIVVVEAVEAQIERGLSPEAATVAAMNEVSGPVVAIALVLCAVFVPVAFMGGITGKLYQQFALTLALSVSLSALVALTLTPALCKLMLRHKSPMRGPIGWFLSGFNWLFDLITKAYMGAVRFLIKFLPVPLIALAVISFAAFKMGESLPGGFVPSEDQGYVIALFTLPDGSSLERTNEVLKRAESYLKKQKDVQSVVALGGYSCLTGSYTSNNATIFVILKPWEERKEASQSADAMLSRMRKKFNTYPEAISVSFNPAPIPGLGNAGGFQFELQDRTGSKTLQELAEMSKQVIAAASKMPELVGMYCTYRASVPQVKIDLDRDKVITQGTTISDVFDSMQIYLGGLQVNDFNKFGRTYKVMLQAEPEFRVSADGIKGIYVRSGTGNMMPLNTLMHITSTTGPDIIQRYNLYRTADISGQSAEGFSSGQAMAAMEKLSKTTLSKGFGYEWTGTAYQEKEASGAQALIFGLALIFVFLFLVAQYESWSIPFSVVFGIPVGVFGAFLAVSLRHLINDVYVQIGLVMLIGLSAKNAILIVEFAKEKQKLGLTVTEAALEAARLRFRPILMTSFAFILGVLPLVLADGAGANSRHSLGTAVFGGMLCATAIGVFLIPVLYVVVEELANFSGRAMGKIGGMFKPKKKDNESAAIEHFAADSADSVNSPKPDPVNPNPMDPETKKDSSRERTEIIGEIKGD